jgi:ABC-2 type transport system ATP-binding protein
VNRWQDCAMTELVIETRGLHKAFNGRRGRRIAVQDLDLAVPPGGVHGFLGPNGSGKTTTIRMLLGLARATSGTMHLFGRQVPEHLPEVLPRVGAVVESPKFFPAFTGRENLLLLARSIGVPETAVDEALATVSLTGRDDDRYGSYSLGMKQRLAIAATLVKKPDLLILDEPTNGLDPAGIREIRETIRDLGASGVTVLLSSHILAEVQQVCDSATIIGHGRMLASGQVEDLIGTSTSYRLTVGDPVRAQQILETGGYAVERREGDLWVQTEEDASLINRALVEQGIYLSELVPQRADLESVFLELTAETTLGHGPDLGRKGTR